MASMLSLPHADGSVAPYRMVGSPISARSRTPVFNRFAYAAAHVVSDPRRETDPIGRPAIDWDATLAFRHHLWGLGFKIAEAMDTSQRGMGVDWPLAAELIRRSVQESRTVDGADLACGAGTDQLNLSVTPALHNVIAAYEEQFELIESCGGRAIMMASRGLARAARSADDYAMVYGRLLGQAKDKVILHWLGDMFDPQLKGYWGSEAFETALNTVMAIIEANKSKVAGIKISLLDSACEIALRQRLPDGIVCFTGDDFNYAELIEGDGTSHSHALLGIFDAVAPSASMALEALARDDLTTFRNTIEPTVPLSRKIFETPTMYYKAGVVFLAWLNGHQNHFTMPGGMQSARSFVHYADIFRLADAANVLDHPEIAAERMKRLCAVYGIDE